MADIILNVQVRDRIGTGGSRATRNAGFVPGILYGADKAPVPISVKSGEFRKALHTGKLLGHLVTLKHGEETQGVIAKDIQFHPVTDQPVHFDLYRVDEHQLVKINIPVHFRNQELSPGMKRGAALNISRHEVEVWAPADHIPEDLVADLTGLEIGDSVRWSNLNAPAGVEPVIKGRDFTIATIAGSAASASAEAAANAAG